MKRLLLLLVLLAMLAGTQSAYSLTAPSGILHYLPITITNYQNSALAANTPIAIGTANSITGKVIGFNALAYSQYYTCNLNNAEFFYVNGTIIPSWLEGNILNEKTSNALCTSPSSPNALVDSANVLYWVKIGGNAPNFLPANTGTYTSNMIYLGWAGNVISPSNTLMDGVNTGEAPQLSGTYAQYDNGNSIFGLYLNFNGVSSAAPSGWTFSGSGGSISINDGITLFGASGESAAIYENSQTDPVGNVIDGLITSYTPDSDELLGWSTAAPSGTNSGWWGLAGNAALAGAGGGSPGELELVYVNSGQGYNVKGAYDPANPFTASINWQSATALATINYSIQESSSTASSPSSSYPILYVNNGRSIDVQWYRDRISPPNGVLPGTTSGTIQAPPPNIINTWTASNQVIYQNNQSETLTASLSGGVSPYTYNFLVYAPGGALVYNALYTGVSSSSNSFSFVPSGSGRWVANIIITDNSLSRSTNTLRFDVMLDYLPITLFNYQNSALAANTPIAIGTANTLNGNIIGFNALAYSQYYTCNLNNAEFFFPNGTLAKSWLEGNIINENTANSLCTSALSPNSLSNSANILYWILDPSSNFLPANTGTYTSNMIYLGWAGNVISPSNTLMDGVNTGEAPQLSCSTPSNTQFCSGLVVNGVTEGLYAQYDNGNLLFGANAVVGYYQDWNGTSSPPGWSLTSNMVAITNNGITLSTMGATGSQFYSHNALLNPSYAAEIYGKSAVSSGSSHILYNLLQQAQGTTPANWLGIAQISGDSYWQYTNSISINVDSNTIWALNHYYVSSVLAGPSQQDYLANYTSVATSSFSTPANEYSGVWMDNSVESALNWYRIRAYPPNGKLPGTVLGSVQLSYSPLSSTAWTASNQVIYQNNRSETLKATPSVGISPYTYNFLVYAPNGILTYNAIYAGVFSASNAFSIHPSAAGRWTANIIIYDGSGSESANTLNFDVVQNSLPITLFNYQNSALAANTPIAIGTANTLNGNIIGFNALAYSQYYTCNLNNAEFFFPNGTIIPSWLEGNILGEQTANAMCTSPSSPNALVDSANVLYWVKIGGNAPNFLPANTGTYTSNMIYLGWAGNVISPSNTLMDGVNTGEAPQLSCDTPTNSQECGSINSSYTYAKYDNGNLIFGAARNGFYDNFAGTFLSSKLASSAASGTATVNNGLSLFTDVAGGFAYVYIVGGVNTISSNIIKEGLINIHGSSGSDVRDRNNPFYTSIGNQPADGFGFGDMGMFDGSPVTYFWPPPALGPAVPISASMTQYNIIDSIALLGNGNFHWNSYNALDGYSTIYSNSNTYTPGLLPYVGFGATTDPTGAGTTSEMQVGWMRIREYPPNGSLPGATFGSVLQFSGPAALSLSGFASNPSLPDTLYTGSQISFTATVSGGTFPYSYNFLVANTLSGATVGNYLVTTSSTSNTFTWTIPSSVGTNSLEANVIVTDSSGPAETANSVYLGPLNTLRRLPSSSSFAYIVNPTSGYVAIVNTSSNTVVGTISGFADPLGIAISPTGTFAYVADSGYNKIFIISTATNTITGSITSSLFNGPIGVAFSPSGTFAYVAQSYSNAVDIIDTATNTITGTISGFSHPSGISFSPSGTFAYVTNYYSGNVAIVSAATNTIVGYITGFSNPISVSISPTGTFAYVADVGSEDVYAVNTTTNTISRTISGFNILYSVSISPDGTYAYVGDTGTHKTYLLDTATGAITGNVIGIVQPGFAAFYPLPKTKKVCATTQQRPYVFQANLSAYVPLSICNLESTPTPAPFQQALSVNSLKYQSYEANNLDNAEFFYANGTVIPSWLEGNGMASSPIGASSASTNTTYWLNLSSGILANSSASIFMGFMPKATNLMNGDMVGEAPQLSGTYAQYDNGGRIFSFYLNANSVPSLQDPNGISSYQGGSVGASSTLSTISDATVGNALSVTPASTGMDTYYFLSAPYLPSSFVLTEWYYTSGNAYDAWIGAINSNTLDGYGAMPGDGYNSYLSSYLDGARTLLGQSAYSYPYGKWLSAGLQRYSNGSIESYSENVISLLPGGTTDMTTNALYSGFNAIFFGPYVGTTAYTRLIGLITARAAPPAGIMPSVAFGNVTAILKSTALTVSNPVIDVGQSAIANSMATGGTGGVSGEWAWLSSNSMANKVVNTITVGQSPIGIAINKAGTFAYVTNGINSGQLSIVNLASNTVAHTVQVGAEPGLPALNPDGTIAYVPSYYNDSIDVVNLTTSSVAKTISLGHGLNSVAVNPQGTLMYVTGSGGKVYVMNTTTYNTVNTISVGSGPDYISFSPDGRRAYVTDFSAGTVSVINVTANKTIATITVGSQPSGISVNPQGTLVYVANSGSGTVSVIDAATDGVTNTITTGAGAWTVSFDPSGSIAYVVNSYGNSADMIDVASNSVISAIPTPLPGWVAISPNGRYAYVLNQGGNYISVVSLPETSIQPLPSLGGGNLSTQLTINAISSNEISFTFNGVTYSQSSSPNTIYGTYILHSLINDSASPNADLLLMANTLTINPKLTGSSWTASNGIVEIGQYQTLTASVGGGTPPYTYDFTVYNSIGSLVYNSIRTGVSSQESAFTFAQGSTLGTYTANILVTDSASIPETSASTLSYLVKNALVSGSVTPSSPTIDSGKSITLRANPSAGWPPYTYSWYTSSSGNPSCSAANVILGMGASTIPVSPTTSNTYSYKITDSATTNAVVCSPPDIVTVNPALASPVITASNSLIDGNQYQLLAASVTGGTPPYTYNFFVYNALGILVYSASIQNSLATNSVLFQQPSSWGSGPFTANLAITDSGLSTALASNTYSSHPPFSSSSFTVSNAIGAPPQYETLTANVLGGTSPYTYNFMVNNSAGGIMDSESIQSASPSASFTFQLTSTSTWPSGVYTANVYGIDSATTPAIQFATHNFVVCPAVTFTDALSNSILDLGQYQALSVNVIGCQSPYTYNFMVYDPAGSLVYNSLFSTSQTSNIMTLNANYTGQWTVNVIVTDSESTPASYSRSITYDVYPEPSVGLTPIGLTLDSGQSETITATPSGGAPPYSYQWYTSASTYTACTPSNAILGAEAPSYAATPSASASYSARITDSASVPLSACTPASTDITVNPALSTPTVTSAGQEYDLGSNISLTGSWSGGTPYYSANWSIFYYTSLAYNARYIALSSSSNALVVPTRSLGTGTFNINLSVQDSPSFSEVRRNSVNYTITINPDPTITIMPSATTIYSGNSFTYNAYITGGTGPFALELVSSNGSVIYSTADASAGTTTIGPITPPSRNYTYTYNAMAIDTGPLTHYAFNSTSSSITVVNVTSSHSTQNLTSHQPPAGTSTGGSVPQSGGPPGPGSGPSTPSGNVVTRTILNLTNSSRKGQNVATANSLGENLSNANSITITVNNNTITVNTTTNNHRSTTNISVNGSVRESPPIHFPGATIILVTANLNHLSVIVSNVTSTLEKGLASFERISAFNISIIGNITKTGSVANLTLNYPCSYNPASVSPYVLLNGNWTRLDNYTTDSIACSISMPVSNNSTVALFFAPSSPKTIQPNQVQQSGGLNGFEEGVLATLAAAAIALIIYKILLARKHPWASKAKPKHKAPP